METRNLQLKDVCDFVGGSQPPKSTFSAVKLKDYVRLIQIRDYKTSEYLTYIPKDKTKKFCSTDDIMIGRYGPPIFQILRGLEGAYNVALMKAIPNREILNDYLFYFLKQQHLFKYIDSLSPRTGGQTGVDVAMLKEYPIQLPNLSYQAKVADILRSIDNKIDINNQINNKLEEVANLIFVHWFIKFEFPDNNNRPYSSNGGEMVSNSEFGNDIPKGWNLDAINKVFEFNPSMTIKKGDVCSHLDMNSIPTSGFMTKEPKKKNFTGGMKFQNGDVVVARITPCLENGKTGLISQLKEKEIGFGSTEFIVIRGRSIGLKCFASCLSRSASFRKYAISKMTGTSGRKRVNYTSLEEYKMPLPDTDTLVKFEKKISPYFEQMTLNTKENHKLEKLRDWLLPMLMNGQVTVK